jgi:Phosphorylase superfamily
MSESIQILVPQGAEYKAVCRGLSSISTPRTTPSTTPNPAVYAIPVGSKALIEYLPQWIESEKIRNQKPSQILVMGLCGSLNPRYTVGDIVLYENCVYHDKVGTSLIEKCSSDYTRELYEHLEKQALPAKASPVKSLTSDSVIWSAKQKQQLAQTSAADVVDMEGFTILSFFNQINIPVAMLRVVSDGCDHDIPDLSNSISPFGKIKPLPLTIAMLRQPIAATRLVQGSLKALNTLEQLTKQLFT